MGGGGKAGGGGGYAPPPAPVATGPTSQELAAAEEKRRGQAEAERVQRQKEAGYQGTLGNPADDPNETQKKPTLLGGTTAPTTTGS